MIASACALTRERAEELALGILDGAERAEVLRHVNECASCQAFVHELAEVADALPHLAPDVEPPPGFEHRVLAAMRGDRGRTRRRRVLALAATAAAAAILAVAVVRIVDANRDERSQAAPALRSVAMEGADGLTVGRVTISRGSPAQIAVAVDYAVPEGSYALEVRPDGGAATPLGSMTVASGKGAWTGPVDLAGDHEQKLVMVDASGAVVCEAQLD